MSITGNHISITMPKVDCKECGSSVINLKRHMKTVRHTVPVKVMRPKNLKEFLHLCTLLPIPIDVWSQLIGCKDTLKQYIEGDGMLSDDILYLLHGCFSKYKEDKTRLVIEEISQKKVIEADNETKIQPDNTTCVTKIM